MCGWKSVLISNTHLYEEILPILNAFRTIDACEYLSISRLPN